MTDKVPDKRTRQIAHDLNNLLLVISNCGSRLFKLLKDDTQNQQTVSAILEATDQASNLVRELQRSSRAGKSDTEEMAVFGTDQNGPETILLVEDDSQVRKLVMAELTSQGYDVIEARHGPSAISAALRHHGPVDLLLTDLHLPEMSGPEIAASLRTSFPALSVIYMSGDGHVSGLTNPADSYLQKPFKMAQLRTLVRSRLDQRSR